ncbi:MAG: FimV/HubP family polar landmark protein [Dokdonella sp.]
MKRPLQLSLAIALALGGTNALALGLGPVHVKSKLNQPLDAEIPIIQGTAGEAEGLLVNLAAAEDFERVGINRAHLSIPLDFTLGKGANGEMVIKVTSKDIVRDSYLDFLVEANWPKGRLLREYTVLLDPPVSAPARGAATTSAVASAPSTAIVKRHDTSQVAAQTPAPAALPTPRAVPTPAPVAVAATPSRKVNAGEYGPVAAGETLSGVAHATRVSGTNIDQMMLALLKNNPTAFYKDNVNALKRGAILRVPSADEVKAIGSVSEAAAQVHAQVEDWRGGRASPTRVADAGSSKTPTPTTVATAPPKPPKASAAPKADEHLALVPPKVGKDSMAMADRPGSGAGSAAATSELKSELARTKETLTTQQQESGELKSRVKELEDLKNKNDRLIGLKDSEIADLQQKLKQMQEKSATSTAKPAPPATPLPSASTPATVATATAPKMTTPPAPIVATPPTTSSTPAAATTTAVTPPKTPATAATPNTKIEKQDIWGEAGSSAPTPADAGKSATTSPTTASTTTPTTGATATTPSAPSSTSAATAVSTTTPLAATPPTTSTSPATTPASPPVPPKATTPALSKPISSVKPLAPVETPWYEASWVKPAALGVGVLLLLGGVLGLRKRKALPAGNGRGSIADSFGQSPLKPAGSGAVGSLEEEEASLREQLEMDPSNVGLHLELLSLYYAERDVARFEDAAADMHAQVDDAHQPEWLEAQAMGQELAPHNPLFSDVAHFDDTDAALASAHADTFERPRYDAHEENVTAPSRRPSAGAAYAEPDEDLGFNLGHEDFAAASAPATNLQAKHDESFDFSLPPLDLEAPVTHSTPAAMPAAHKAADLDVDYFPVDDAIGTKLDLAKAYMDMGDPEGARSMLEEVVAEGSDAQKTEAHRLIAEIR